MRVIKAITLQIKAIMASKIIHSGENVQNCGRFGHKYLQCGKYGCSHNTPLNGQKTIYHNFKQHPSQYLQQFPVSPSLQNVLISPHIQIQPDGTALLIQQLVMQ